MYTLYHICVYHSVHFRGNNGIFLCILRGVPKMSTGINFCKNRPIHYYVLPNNTDLLCRTPSHGLSTLSLPDQEKVEGNHTSVLRVNCILS